MRENNLASFVFASLPFVLMCVLYRKSNLKKEERGYQFASIFFGIIYSAAAILYSNKLASQVLNFLKKLALKLTEFGNRKPFFSGICERIVNFINNTDWEVYMIFVINFLVLLVFIILKKIILPLFKKAWKNDKLFNSTSGKCYEWSDARRSYVLKAKCMHLRIMMNVYYAIAVIIAVVLLNACRSYPDWPGFKAVVYPFALVIVLGEIVFFLGGKTELEFADDVGGDGGSSFKVVNYYRLRKYLTSVFGDRVISQDTYLPKYHMAHNNSEIVKKYENIDLQEARIANLYFKHQNESGLQLDEGYVDATYRMMNGESVLFANPFYKDLSKYIFLPLNRAATKGKKILFIVGQNGIDGDVKEWINNSFSNVTSVNGMWTVGNLNCNEAFDGEVGIVIPADIFDTRIVAKNKSFLSKVSNVIMLEPSCFVSTAQLSISLYISEVKENAVYCIIDKNSDGFVDTMSHIIRQSIKEVSATNKERNRASYMIWKADGEQLNHRIFPNVARYLGVGTELMIAGIRNQVNLTEWYSYSKFPVIDMKWISEQYYQPLCEYASLNPKQEELERRMNFNNNIWNAEKDDYKYIVVEDETCNMFEMLRQFLTRGKSESFVNIISQNYMLRDYMECNSGLFEADPKAIPEFCPDYSRTERNIVIELLMKLSSGRVSKDYIIKQLRYIEKLTVDKNISKYELKSIIFDLVFKYFKEECTTYVVTETTLVEEYNDLYTITNRTFIDAALGSLKCAYYVLEDEESEKHYLDAKLFGHVYQSHLPGQYIVIGGKYYEILFISFDKGVVVKRAADSIHSREYYRQLRNYSISQFELDDKIGATRTMGNIIVERGFASFKVQTSGYLLLSDYGDIKNSFKREISNVPDRVYSGKYSLKITLPGTTSKIRATICVVLNELFKTIYPDNCNYICAVTQISDDLELLSGVLYTAEFETESKDCIYIIEDSVLDLGLISSVERNLKRFLEIVTDFLKWYKLSLLPIPLLKDTVELPSTDKLTDDDSSNSNDEEAKQPKNKEKKRLKDLFKRKKKDKSPKHIEQVTKPLDLTEKAEENSPEREKSESEVFVQSEEKKEEIGDKDIIENDKSKEVTADE